MSLVENGLQMSGFLTNLKAAGVVKKRKRECVAIEIELLQKKDG